MQPPPVPWSCVSVQYVDSTPVNCTGSMAVLICGVNTATSASKATHTPGSTAKGSRRAGLSARLALNLGDVHRFCQVEAHHRLHGITIMVHLAAGERAGQLRLPAGRGEDGGGSGGGGQLRAAALVLPGFLINSWPPHECMHGPQAPRAHWAVGLHETGVRSGERASHLTADESKVRN